VPLELLSPSVAPTPRAQARDGLGHPGRDGRIHTSPSSGTLYVANAGDPITRGGHTIHGDPSVISNGCILTFERSPDRIWVRNLNTLATVNEITIPSTYSLTFAPPLLCGPYIHVVALTTAGAYIDILVDSTTFIVTKEITLTRGVAPRPPVATPTGPIFLSTDLLTVYKIGPALAEQWSKTYSGQVNEISPWPTEEADLLVQKGPQLDWFAEDGTAVASTNLGDTSITNLLAVSSTTPTDIWLLYSSIGRARIVRKSISSVVNVGGTATVDQTVYPPIGTYFLNPYQVANYATSHHRPYFAIDRYGFALTASPDPIIGPPTSMWLVKITQAGTRSVSIHTAGTPAIGLEAGSVQTDYVGNAYVTYRRPQTRWLRWTMRVFRTDLTPWTSEIFVPAPGYPQQGSDASGGSQFLEETVSLDSHIMADSPTLFWTLADRGATTSVFDSTTNAKDGTRTGTSATGPALLAGVDDPSYAFGTSVNVTTPDSANLDGATNITIEVSLQTFASLPTGTHTIFSKSGVYSATFDGTNRSISFTVVTSGGSTTLGGGAIPTGTPCRLAFRYNGATMSTWLNGSSVASVAKTGTLVDNTNALILGGPSGSQSSVYMSRFAIFRTAIADARLLDRSNVAIGTARTATARKLTNQAVDQADLLVSVVANRTTYDQPTAPLTLTPAFLTPGGVLELWQRRSNVSTRLAYANDIVAGLQLTRSLTNLDKLNFAVPLNRFIPAVDNSGSALDLQRNWRITHPGDDGPFNKPSFIRDDVYITYTDSTPSNPRRVQEFRVDTITNDGDTISGSATSAAVELGDRLTQYVAGRSQFAGKTPTDIADRVLRGHQSLSIQNRRFTRDSPVRMFLANEIADQSPRFTPDNFHSGPLAGVTEYVALNPADAALFSGIPSDTVGPDGTDRNLTAEFPPGGYGIANWFGVLQWENEPIDALNVRQGPIALVGNYPEEPNGVISRLYWGCYKAPATGITRFRLQSDNGQRAFFRGAKVTDYYNSDGTANLTWSSDMVANRWYPFIFHYNAFNPAGNLFQWYHTPPGSGELLVPNSAMSPLLFKGVGLLRFVDVTGVTRFQFFYKRWDGKALVVLWTKAAIFPMSWTGSTQLWPNGAPAGTLIEEYNFPSNDPYAQVLNWGSGWTRRGGAGYRTGDFTPLESSIFQPRSEEY
jgi:hypothetical protein